MTSILINVCGILNLFHFADFLYHPLLGSAFLLQSGLGTGYYPHNIILEVMMATGLLGLCCFAGWLSILALSGFKIIRNDGPGKWVVFIMMQYFILELTSYSIMESSYFWYFSVLVVCLGQSYRWTNKD